MPGAQNVFHEALPIVFAKLVQEEPFSKLFDTESYTHFNFIYLFIFFLYENFNASCIWVDRIAEELV